MQAPRCGCACRFTRLINAFARKVENYASAVALHMMYYNVVRIHWTLKLTPAMAAGFGWIRHIVALVDAAEIKSVSAGHAGKRRLDWLY